MASAHTRLGQILRKSGKLSGTQLIRALDQQKIGGRKLGQILLDDEAITEADLVFALHEQLQIPVVDFSRAPRSREALAIIPQEYAIEHMILPLVFLKVRQGKVLVLAMEDPTQKSLIQDLHRLTGYSIKPLLATRSDLVLAIRNSYPIFHREMPFAP